MAIVAILIVCPFLAILWHEDPGGLGRGDSDGLVVLRALFPASRFVLLTVSDVGVRPQRPLRAPFAIVLAALTVVAFFANVWLGLFMVAFLGLAYMAERHGCMPRDAARRRAAGGLPRTRRTARSVTRPPLAGASRPAPH